MNDTNHKLLNPDKMQTNGAILQTINSSLLAIKMIRFLDVASFLFFSYIAVVAADSIPRVQTSDGVALWGRFTVCSSPGESES